MEHWHLASYAPAPVSSRWIQSEQVSIFQTHGAEAETVRGPRFRRSSLQPNGIFSAFWHFYFAESLLKIQACQDQDEPSSSEIAVALYCWLEEPSHHVTTHTHTHSVQQTSRFQLFSTNMEQTRHKDEMISSPQLGSVTGQKAAPRFVPNMSLSAFWSKQCSCSQTCFKQDCFPCERHGSVWTDFNYCPFREQLKK